MKNYLFSILFSATALSISAAPSASAHENSTIDRRGGIALKVAASDSAAKDGSIIVTVELKNEELDQYAWSGWREHPQPKQPELRDVFWVNLVDREGNECQLTETGRLALRKPPTTARDGKGHFYILQKGKSFSWEFDITKYFKFAPGHYDIVVKPTTRGGPAVQEGNSADFDDIPDVRVLGKRIKIGSTKGAKDAEVKRGQRRQ